MMQIHGQENTYVAAIDLMAPVNTVRVDIDNEDISSSKGRLCACKKASDSRKSSKDGCPYKTQTLVENLSELAVMNNFDFEDLVQEGERLQACAYYDARSSVPIDQIVLLSYELLFHLIVLFYIVSNIIRLLNGDANDHHQIWAWSVLREMLLLVEKSSIFSTQSDGYLMDARTFLTQKILYQQIETTNVAQRDKAENVTKTRLQNWYMSLETVTLYGEQ
ncbi:hypothetical protein GQX74_010605 [Glossina fuscipes]|nr:hypothetical protein GQX74_010605 [Glossina fuscipes]